MYKENKDGAIKSTKTSIKLLLSMWSKHTQTNILCPNIKKEYSYISNTGQLWANVQKIFLRPEWRNYTLIFCHPLVHFRQSLVTVWWDMTSDFWDLWADIYQGRLTTTPEYASTIYIRVSYWSLENWIGALKHVKIWLSQRDTCLSCQICYVCYILHVCQVCYWRYFQR